MKLSHPQIPLHSTTEDVVTFPWVKWRGYTKSQFRNAIELMPWEETRLEHDIVSTTYQVPANRIQRRKKEKRKRRCHLWGAQRQMSAISNYTIYTRCGCSSRRANIASRAIHALIHCCSWFWFNSSKHKIRRRHCGHAGGSKCWCLAYQISQWLRCKCWNDWLRYRRVTKPKTDARGCAIYLSGRHIIPKNFNLKLLKLLRHSCIQHWQPDQFGKENVLHWKQYVRTLGIRVTLSTTMLVIKMSQCKAGSVTYVTEPYCILSSEID